MKDTIDMANETLDKMAPDDYCRESYWTATDEEIKAFAALVRADEREACARIADSQLLNTNALLTAPIQSSAAYQIGVSIRARCQA